MKVVSFLVLLLSFCNTIYSQEYCERNPYCTDHDLLFSAPYNQAPATQGPDYGCLLTQPNPTFFELKITQSGSIAIAIEGKSIPSMGSGQDVDFICWGPYPSTFTFNNCDSLTTNYHLDCGNSASYSETLNIPNAVLGEIYVLMTSNVSNANQGILIKKIGGTGEANAQCGPPPKEICYGQFTVVQDTNGGNLTNPTYSIHPGAITNTTGMFIVTPTITTTYTLFSTGLNSQSVLTTFIDSVTITVYPLAGITLNTIQSKCTNTLNFANLNVYFLPPSAATGYSIYWHPVPGSSPNYTQTSVSNLTPGPNFVFIKPDNGCGTAVNFMMSGLPAPPVFSVSPPHPYQIVSCAYPTRTISASNQNLVYNWTSLSAPSLTGQIATFNNLSAGTWTVNGKDTVTECITSRTIHISLDFTPPTSTLVPIYQTITCANSAVQTVTTTSTPSINIEHQFFWNNGLNVQGIHSNSAIISPPPGTHTYVLINRVNGCKTAKTFSVASSGGFPTYTITSPIQNFSVGCAPKNVVDIVITNAQSSPPGQPVTYTILTPGASTLYTLGSQTSYSFSQPGIYAVAVRDNNSGCESVSPFSINSKHFCTSNFGIGGYTNPLLLCTYSSIDRLQHKSK